MKHFKLRFEVWKSYVTKIGEMLLNDEYLISSYFKKEESNYIKFKENYENNFIKYKSNERFTIPIIGKISSGKSTFLNAILRGNYLSSASNVATKFICIFRHNKDCISPILYKCDINQEILDYKYNNFKYFYFKETEEIKGDILENIKKINEDLKNYEKKINKNERDINKYFYILKLNIPLFNENEELSNYFELMDIPGLNELNDFYLTEIIPLLINKCLFSIYIFDLTHYENQDTLNVYKNYSMQINKFYKTNSIYILNKIDSITKEDRKNFKDEDYHFTKFKNYLSKSMNVDLNTNQFLRLNSKELFNKENAFSDLKIFISHIIDTIEIEKKNELFSIKDYIKENINKYFEITKEELIKIFESSNDEIFKDYFDEKEFDEILNIIISKGLTAYFEEIDYQKFKYIFVNKKKIDSTSPVLNNVYQIILSSMSKSLEEFLNWNYVSELMKTFKESLNNIFKNEEERRKYTEICDNLLKSFLEELDKKSKLKNMDWKVNTLDSLKSIIDSLISLEQDT